MQKVGTEIKGGESYYKVAKELRHDVSLHPGNHGFTFSCKDPNPSEYSWAIYENYADNLPVLHSMNWEGETMQKNPRGAMTLEEFLEGIDVGLFTDYDGFAYWSNGTEIFRELYLYPSDVTTNSESFQKWSKVFTHVVWYNK